MLMSEYSQDLLVANESLQPPPRKKMKIHVENDEVSTYETELEEATRSASALQNAYAPVIVIILPI
jgi:hypothetical protein